LVEPGDFVISLRSFEGGLEYSRYTGLVSPAYTVLKPRLPICDDYYRHLFKSWQFIGRLAVAVIGIRDGKQVSYEDFSFLKLPYPKLDDQKRIASMLNQAEALIENHRRQLEKLRSEKCALMAQLITGNRSIPMPDLSTEALA
jgi:type I restriction enzyme S subunit